MISILIIGNEILSAQVENSNLSHMLHCLAEAGLPVDEVRIVGDSIDDISGAIRDMRQRSRFVISTGGLGPTHDDVTMSAFADAFDVPLIVHPELESRMQAFFKDRLKASHLNMARVPQNAELIDSGNRSFPLVRIGNCFALPGLPELFVRKLSLLLSILPAGEPIFYAEVLTSASETAFASALEDIVARHPDVEIGSYPNYDRSHFAARITVKGKEEERVAACFTELERYFKGAGSLISCSPPKRYEPIV